MERLISEEERIRRAEEISERRKNKIPASNININRKPRLTLLSKVFLQVIISISIFGIIYFLNQNNSIAIEKIKPILSEDTDFIQIYNQIDDFVKNINNNINEKGNEEIEEKEKAKNEEIKEDKENEENKENKENKESNNDNQSDNKEENELKIENPIISYIKANANIIKPINGWITSRYGEREGTDIISSNHEGIDIGANYGDEIKSAMSGTVELVSNEGDYGNHLKIANGEISTLYAHCSTIVVKQGDYVEQGQKIAEVGSTRKINRTTSTF